MMCNYIIVSKIREFFKVTQFPLLNVKASEFKLLFSLRA